MKEIEPVNLNFEFSKITDSHFFYCMQERYNCDVRNPYGEIQTIETQSRNTISGKKYYDLVFVVKPGKGFFDNEHEFKLRYPLTEFSEVFFGVRCDDTSGLYTFFLEYRTFQVMFSIETTNDRTINWLIRYFVDQEVKLFADSDLLEFLRPAIKEKLMENVKKRSYEKNIC